MPRLCQPYRARTKGKVDRFHRYLRGNFYVPLSSWLKQSGMVLDVDTANAEVGKWLRDVVNQRVHLITGQSPAVLFEQRERAGVTQAASVCCDLNAASAYPTAVT